MSNQQTKVLGVNVSNLNFKEVLEYVEKSLKCNNVTRQQGNNADEKPLVIFTPNPEIVVYAQKDEEFKKIVNTAQINIPDGVGLIWAAKFLGKPLKERIQGVDLLEKLVELAAGKSLTVGLIGGREGVAVKALERLRSKYPKLNGVILDSPEFRVENETISCPRPQPHASLDPSPAESAGLGMTNKYFKTLAQEIKDKKIDILFVGLGAPKQEYFIDNLVSVMLNSVQHLKCHPRESGDPERIPEMNSGQALKQVQDDVMIQPLVLMSVGGSFDYLSGRVKRAPVFIRKIGFEWVWRLVCQPWRLKRQLSLLKFLWLVIKEKLYLTRRSF